MESDMFNRFDCSFAPALAADQAVRHNSRLTILLGNHELLNLHGDYRYVSVDELTQLGQHRQHPAEEGSSQASRASAAAAAGSAAAAAGPAVASQDGDATATYLAGLEVWATLWSKPASSQGPPSLTAARPASEVAALDASGFGGRITGAAAAAAAAAAEGAAGSAHAEVVERHQLLAVHGRVESVSMTWYDLLEGFRFAAGLIAQALNELLALQSCDSRACPDGAALLHRTMAVLSSGQGPVWSRQQAQGREGGVCWHLGQVLARLGVRRLVVGHTPQATGRAAARCGGRLLLLDTGMSSGMHGSPAAAWLCHEEGVLQPPIAGTSRFGGEDDSAGSSRTAGGEEVLGQQALQQHAAVVLSVRRVPWQLAAVMQEAGLQLTTENLVAAARSRVEGLESWMVGPYYTKLEPLVLAVMTGRLVELEKLLQAAWVRPGRSKQQARMLDLMHLATNQTRPAAASVLFNVTATWEAILQLLHRSVVRKNPAYEVTDLLLQLAAAADAAAAAEAPLPTAPAAAAAAWDDDDGDGARLSCDGQALQLQHKQEPQQQAVGWPALLHASAAVSRRNYNAVRQLVGKQALQTLDAAACSSLARTAMELHDSATLDALAAAGGAGMARVLLGHPAAQNISVEDAMQLAETALAASTELAVVTQLLVVCSLPAAAQLAAADLRRLLAIAVEDSVAGDQAVAQLCALTPAVLGLAADDVAQLLTAAALSGNASVADALIQLPAASELQADALHAVLRAALDACKPAVHTIVGQLCELAGAQQLQPQQLLSLLPNAIRIGSLGIGTSALRSLLQLPAAQQVQPGDASALLSLVLQSPHADDLLDVLLAGLPVVKQMDAAQLEAHVRTALANEDAMVAAALLALPAAAALAHEDVAALLVRLMDQVRAPARLDKAAHAFDLLCGLPAAQKMPPQRLVELLQKVDKAVLLELLGTAVLRMTGKGVTCICRMLSRHGLSRSEADVLLELNEQMGHAFDQTLAATLQALVQ
ncbi:hypothetical protein COO60DRAFT_1704259 [Scenedesmus sp. NREL 46B-D3]|nr:hypothetical protein COO60DRAFT_1704259 [Scenedesmus sp. NREL 46B-D3]